MGIFRPRVRLRSCFKDLDDDDGLALKAFIIVIAITADRKIGVVKVHRSAKENSDLGVADLGTGVCREVANRGKQRNSSQYRCGGFCHLPSHRPDHRDTRA